MDSITLKNTDGTKVEGTAYESHAHPDFLRLGITPNGPVSLRTKQKIALKWKGVWQIGKVDGESPMNKVVFVDVPRPKPPTADLTADFPEAD